jgi:hypothetical protein
MPPSVGQRLAPPAESSCGTIAGTWSQERNVRQRAGTASSAPSTAGGGQRDALPANNTVGTNRERRGQIAGLRVEQLNRELIAERKHDRTRPRPSTAASATSRPMTARGVSVAAKLRDHTS